jgi:hypothetical protein
VVPTCDAELLLSHVNHKTHGKIQHLVDGTQWKQFDLAHREDFSNDPKNIRFGLSMDGMSPFRELRDPHSMWIIIMCIFNLPPWLCHKRRYLFLTTLTSSLKQAGNDIDVFLEPFMEDMQKLWQYGVTVWDEYSRQPINLKAIIFYTINDNSARLSLTG